jgi:hypothetical protein
VKLRSLSSRDTSQSVVSEPELPACNNITIANASRFLCDLSTHFVTGTDNCHMSVLFHIQNAKRILLRRECEVYTETVSTEC